ncbi:MAG: L-threonylcarbamoyladenylate synthase [Bifidobacteriaceae bacterium]|nr:L-threonylcarbamoyladenylate synthase [Bifidobacteriaceae bacterium]
MKNVYAINEDSLRKAQEIIASGGVIVLPTDTVYGIACDPKNSEAIQRIYEIKGRPQYKALQVLLADVEDLENLGLELPSPLNRLAAKFLPGAFSPIAQANEICTLKTLSRNDAGVLTQGVRVPNSAACLRILRATGALAASSANKSGQESAQSVEEAYDAFGGSVDLYLNGGATKGHTASTVVIADIHGRDGIRIIREGVIPQSQIVRAIHENAGGLGS